MCESHTFMASAGQEDYVSSCSYRGTQVSSIQVDRDYLQYVTAIWNQERRLWVMQEQVRMDLGSVFEVKELSIILSSSRLAILMML